MLITISTNVRTNEMTADIFPFENAVNIEDEKILIPANIQLIENKKNPVLAISYVFVVRGVKISTMVDEDISASAVTEMEETTINPIQ